MFRTPIGFHDAYVAATSQKAALEAWGAESNLFAQGIAEPVSDPKLMKAPLERSGEVIKILRGSTEEQIRALAAARSKTRSRAANDDPSEMPSPRSRLREGPAERERQKKRPPRPSRSAVDKAERALKEAEQEHRQATKALRDEEKAFAERRRKLEEKQERELGRLRSAADEAQDQYRDSMAQWAKGFEGE